MRKITALAACLLVAGAAQAQQSPAQAAIDEAVSVHAIATAARLCNLISETDLMLATNRMDRVHAGQLATADQETYLILRGSDSFRNMVFAAALRRAQGGCAGELSAVWRDVNSTLISADLANPANGAATNLLGNAGR
jgi:hypothetical protein